MGCPGGTRSVFTRAFWAKRDLQCKYFSGKRRSLLRPNTAQRSFFPLKSFFRKKLKKNGPEKARVNTDATTSDRAHLPWASHNTP